MGSQLSQSRELSRAFKRSEVRSDTCARLRPRWPSLARRQADSGALHGYRWRRCSGLRTDGGSMSASVAELLRQLANYCAALRALGDAIEAEIRANQQRIEEIRARKSKGA